MRSLSRLLGRAFSTEAASTISVANASVSSTRTAINKSISKVLYKERNFEQLVEKFKDASKDEYFRSKIAIYKETVRRLASAGKHSFIIDILEDQKQYKDMEKEGFNARLICLYGFSGMFEKARKVFDEMIERKSPRTVVSFNALLGACINSKKFDEVDGLFRGLSKELAIEPDLVSYNTVIKAFCEMGSLDSAVSLLDEMKKKGFEPNLITFNTLLHGFYVNRRFADGERIWEQMKEKNVKPDIRSYTNKLLGLAVEKRMKDSVKIVEEMKSEGIELDAFIYTTLIRGFVGEDDLEEAKNWYGELGESNCKLDRWSFQKLIPFALEKGDIEFAFDLCKDVLRSKLVVEEALIQPVVNELAKQLRIEAAMELLRLGEQHRGYSYMLKLP